MISKDLFIKSINAIKRYDELRNKLYQMGIDLDCKDDSPINEIIDCLSTALSENMNDKDDYSMIDYFMHELDFGRKEGIHVWEANGDEIPLHSVEDLWNYLIQYIND